MGLIFNRDNSTIMKFEVNEGNRYYRLLRLLSFYTPFSTLGKREMEVLSLIWKEYKESDAKKNMTYGYIFYDASFKNSVCDRLNIEKSNYHNVIKNLRKKKFLNKESIPKTYEIFLDNLKPNIVFNFINNE